MGKKNGFQLVINQNILNSIVKIYKLKVLIIALISECDKGVTSTST
jgi:hypothetical protein